MREQQIVHVNLLNAAVIQVLKTSMETESQNNLDACQCGHNMYTKHNRM